MNAEERHDAENYIYGLKHKIMTAITDLACEDGSHHVHTPSATVALVEVLMDIASLEMGHTNCTNSFQAELERMRQRTYEYFAAADRNARKFGV
jgi:hypothetical protein